MAHESHFQCDLRQGANLLARDLFPPPRGHRRALDSVSFIVDTFRARMNEKITLTTGVFQILRRGLWLSFQPSAVFDLTRILAAPLGARDTASPPLDFSVESTRQPTFNSKLCCFRSEFCHFVFSQENCPTSCDSLQCAHEPSCPPSQICIQDTSCCDRVSAHRLS